MAIGIVFALAAMLFSSGNVLTPIFAQAGGDAEGNGSERENYEEFVRCLSEAEDNRGFATEQQIRDCFAPLYNTGTAATGTGATANTADGGNDNTNDNDSESDNRGATGTSN
ncbi:MAG: hypothetical protein M3162_08935 [Thermoproteota archaeon]|nr:hypothetical protein [Thermoproteota archaeon]